MGSKRKNRKKKEGKEKKAKKNKKLAKEICNDEKAQSPAPVVPPDVPSAAPERAASPKREASPPSPPLRRMELSPSPQEKTVPLAKEKKKAKKQKRIKEKKTKDDSDAEETPAAPRLATPSPQPRLATPSPPHAQDNDAKSDRDNAK